MSSDPTETNGIETNAERLLDFGAGLLETARHTQASYANGGSGTADEVPLYLCISKLAVATGCANGAEMTAKFYILCDSVRNDIGMLSYSRENRRTTALHDLEICQGFLSDKNLAAGLNKAYDRSFSSEIIRTLEDVADRTSSAGLKEHGQETLEDAISALKDAVDTAVETNKYPAELISLLRTYIEQLERSIEQYMWYGEEAFWKIYRESFASFLNIHTIVVPKLSDDERGAVGEKLKKVGGRLMVPFNVAAGSASLISFGMQLLG